MTNTRLFIDKESMKYEVITTFISNNPNTKRDAGVMTQFTLTEWEMTIDQYLSKVYKPNEIIFCEL